MLENNHWEQRVGCWLYYTGKLIQDVELLNRGVDMGNSSCLGQFNETWKQARAVS
jgi:hypothetical protein